MHTTGDDLSRATGSQDRDTPRRLSPWNPLDYLRLLWWVLITPRRLLAYRETWGDNAERRLARWLASTLACFPFLLLVLGLRLETLAPSAGSLPVPVFFLMVSALVVLWLLMALIASRDRASEGIALGLFAVLGALILVLVGITVINVVPTNRTYRILIVSAGILTVGGLGHAFEKSISKHMETRLITGRPSSVAQGAFALLILAYILLVWSSFLGN